MCLINKKALNKMHKPKKILDYQQASYEPGLIVKYKYCSTTFLILKIL